MNFYLYSPVSIKPWDPRDSEMGIGGIETAITETAKRLAKRGHKVTVYIDKQGPDVEVFGVQWMHYEHTDFEQTGVWVIYRSPDAVLRVNLDSEVWFKAEDWNYDWSGTWVDRVDHILVLCRTHVQYILRDNPNLEQKILLTSHGVKVDLIDGIEKEKPERHVFDWHGSLSSNPYLQEHARKVFRAGHEVFVLPELAKGHEIPYAEMLDRIGIPYNKIYRVYDGENPKSTAMNKLRVLKALKADAFYDDNPTNIEVASEHGIPSVLVGKGSRDFGTIRNPLRRGRNPRKIMYASSPDRGLYTLLELMPKIREVVPDVELHVFYGFDGIDDLITAGKWPEKSRVATDDLKRLILSTGGVVWRGRVSQRELYQEWLSSGMMVYPTMFAELTFISGLEAQCCGAIPVVTNVWAQGENTKYGIKINGDPSHPLVKAQFVAEICRLAKDIEDQETIRFKMVEEARGRCSWDRWVDQWIDVAQKGPLYKKTRKCRSCGSNDLKMVVDLGKQSIATIFPKKEDRVLKAPLEVVKCQSCQLSQLSLTVNREYLFRQEYGYRSGINESMREHLQAVSRVVPTHKDDILVDIGCNDGTLIGYLPVDTKRIGFDPNVSCPTDPTDQNCSFIRDFFSHGALLKETNGGKANVIYSLAMFYDLDDPTGFAGEVWESLDDNGAWVIEVQDSAQLISKGAFDFICHEHVTNWDLDQLCNFLGKNRFRVDHHEFNEINGGSVLVVARKSQHAIDYPNSVQPWELFGESLHAHKESFRKFLDALKPEKIWAYGASTKGNVLLQYYGITSKDVEFVVDRNGEKVGRFTPGTMIPIVSEGMARQVRPSYLMALPWGFIDAFRKREPWAKFIVPFPEPRIYQPWEDEEKQRKDNQEAVGADR